ncbi:MAG TPA: hypothetical protein VN516_02305 [Candidatus Baltobacteraceae bacterium]|nr:hypothetical protein [Candidatus Baltobacteraceae bacterium]
MKQKTPRRFEFGRDTFAFANELLWEYQFDSVTGKMNFRKRVPKPDYALRCFVLTRVARQFLYHSRFDAEQKIADDKTYRDLIRKVLSRDPRKRSEDMIVIPGFAGLRDFSGAREKLLKAECGGAWRSYFLRSHWRMIFPISRKHQERTAKEMFAEIQSCFSPIIHLLNFPSLNINHGMILFDAVETNDEIQFSAYDPNLPAQPAKLTFNRATRTFSLPANTYWAGGKLDVIEIFRKWIL